MKNTMMILATMLLFAVACGSPKQVEEVEQSEEIVVEMETDLEEVSEVDSLKAEPIK
jgi:uncharacterized protein YcfL